MEERRERPALLTLPPEIRLLVYKFLFTPTPSDFFPDLDFNFDPWELEPQKWNNISEWPFSIQYKLAPLLVCRLIYRECREIAHQLTVFHITKVTAGAYRQAEYVVNAEGRRRYRAAWASWRERLRQRLSGVAASTAPHVRRLCIHDRCAREFFYAWKDQVSEQRAFITGCKFTNLEHLTLKSGWHYGDMYKEDVVLLAIELFPKLRSFMMIQYGDMDYIVGRNQPSDAEALDRKCARKIQEAVSGNSWFLRDAIRFDHYAQAKAPLEPFCIGVRGESGEIRHVSVLLGWETNAEEYILKYLQGGQHECKGSVSLGTLLRMDFSE